MGDDEDLEKIEQTGKKSGKDAVRKIAKNATKAIVSVVKKIVGLFMKFFGKYLIIIMLVALIVASMWYALQDNNIKQVLNAAKSSIVDLLKDGGDSDNPDVNQDKLDFSKVASIEGDETNGYYIKISKEILNKIESKLKENGIEPKDLGLKSFDCFKNFILAEIKTQFPDLGNTNLTSNSDDIVTNGCIKIKRAKINDKNQSQVIDLKYTTKENFDSMCNNNNENALNYFTLDKNGKLIVASDSYTKVVVTTSGDTSIVQEMPKSKEEKIITALSPIDYKPVISKYTLPFAFMLDILASSGGEDLALGIASLADTTQLEITIETTVQENHSEENYQYTQKDEGTKGFFYSIHEVINYEASRPVTKLLEANTAKVNASPNEKKCTVNVVTDSKYSICNVELTKADAWIAKAEKLYQPADVESTSSGPTSTKLDEIKENANKEEYDLNTDVDVKNFIEPKITYWKKETDKESLPPGSKSRTVVSNKRSMDVSDLYKVTNCTQTTSSSSTERKYNVTTLETVSNEDKVFDIFTNNRDSFYKMKDAQEFLYEELERESTTSNFADIMRYLINKFENPNYKGTLDLGFFDLGDFENVSEDTTGNILADYIRIWENLDLYKYYKGLSSTSKYVSGEYYKTYGDGHTNIAYGDVIDEPWNDEDFKRHGVEPSVLRSYKPGQVFKELKGTEVEEVFEEIVNKMYEATKSSIDSSILSQLSENQIHALTVLSYQYGNIGNFNKVYIKYSQGDKEGFKQSFTISGGHPFLNGIPKARGESNWKLFDQGIYEGNGITLDPSDYISIGGSPKQFLKKAEEVKAYIVNNNYKYTQNASELPGNKNSYRNAKGVCCATYVTWVMHEAGLDEYIGDNLNSTTALYNKLKEKNVTEVKVTNESVLKEGDILFYKRKYDDGSEGDFTHVDIYAGNGKKWNAGSAAAVRIKGTQNLYISSGEYQTDSSGRKYKSTLVLAMRLKFQGSGGTWKEMDVSGNNKFYGTFTSGITGKTFSILAQWKVSGWGSKCNRALAASILSGYVSDSFDNIISYTGPIWSGADNNAYFGRGKLKSEYLSTSTSYMSYVKDKLPKGHYIAMHIGNSNYRGKSGKKWSSSMHWVGILGYKTENSKIKIFVADVGHGNTGWYDLNEFETANIDHIEDVYEK